MIVIHYYYYFVVMPPKLKLSAKDSAGTRPLFSVIIRSDAPVPPGLDTTYDKWSRQDYKSIPGGSYSTLHHFLLHQAELRGLATSQQNQKNAFLKFLMIKYDNLLSDDNKLPPTRRKTLPTLAADALKYTNHHPVEVAAAEETTSGEVAVPRSQETRLRSSLQEKHLDDLMMLALELPLDSSFCIPDEILHHFLIASLSTKRERERERERDPGGLLNLHRISTRLEENGDERAGEQGRRIPSNDVCDVCDSSPHIFFGFFLEEFFFFFFAKIFFFFFLPDRITE